MAPLTSRQIFVWTLPTLFLLSFLWYKRKKGALRSDPGGTDRNTQLVEEKTSRITNSDNSNVIVENKHNEKIPSNLVTIKSDLAALGSDDICEADIALAKTNIEVKTKITDILANSSEEVISEIVNLKSEIRYISADNSFSSTSECATSIEPEIISVSVDNLTAENIGQREIESENADTSGDSPNQNITNLAKEDIVSLTSLLNPEAKDFIAYTLDNQSDIPSTASTEILANQDKVIESWSAECELELGDAMARELSSDVPLEGTVSEEDCTARKLHVEALSLESKLSSLELDDSDVKVTITNKVLLAKERNGIERDSANHSPADVMLGSPSISNCSDEHSEGSSDSGKGCSDVATPPSRTPASGSSVSGDAPTSSVYEFVLPQLLVGRLIGRHGVFVHQIKTKTHANILIKRHPDTAKLKICAVEGTQMDIENALEMIRQKFPLKRYPNVTLDQVSFLAPVTTCPLMPESFQLQLIEGVNNDVILSSLVSPAHFFLQQPTHPTYPSLNRLNMCMNYCYNEPSAPVLPMPVESSVICVAPTMGGWYRAQVMSSEPENETSYVKFIDYGGFQLVENSSLRQIRSDFINLPFQAAECYLANVKPKDGVWAAEAVAFVEQLTHGQVIQAQIYGYAEDGIPVVYLYSLQGSQVLVVNRELVSRGYAEWDEPTETDATMAIEA